MVFMERVRDTIQFTNAFPVRQPSTETHPMPAPKKARKTAADKLTAPVDLEKTAGTTDVADSESSATATTVKPTPKRSGKRVLLVDDDNEIVESMRTVLESRGYEILIARDGNQGLLMAEKEEPDLVVLDMMMPKRSGFLVLEKLRRSRSVPMRVIMITANEGSRHKAYAEMLGVDDYLRKPFSMDRLLQSIDRLLS